MGDKPNQKMGVEPQIKRRRPSDASIDAAKGTKNHYESLLDRIEKELGSQIRSILKQTYSEILTVLKKDQVKDPKKKREVDALLQGDTKDERFSLIVNMSQKIIGYSSEITAEQGKETNKGVNRQKETNLGQNQDKTFVVPSTQPPKAKYELVKRNENTIMLKRVVNEPAQLQPQQKEKNQQRALPPKTITEPGLPEKDHTPPPTTDAPTQRPATSDHQYLKLLDSIEREFGIEIRKILAKSVDRMMSVISSELAKGTEKLPEFTSLLDIDSHGKYSSLLINLSKKIVRIKSLQEMNVKIEQID